MMKKIMKTAVTTLDTAKRGYDNFYWLILVFITGSISIPLAGLKGAIAPILTFGMLWLAGHFHKKVGGQRGEAGDLPSGSNA